jgi:Flp pilus assembly protein TadG
MIASPWKQVTRLVNRRTRNGQSIILVAFAFIALIAFVGIATDVALLFVRFSTLRRAVDAAAIAAAGQVRENATFLTLHAVAQQYIQMHGVQSSTVTVETCETEVYDWQKANNKLGTAYNVEALNELINAKSELCKKNPQKLVRVSAQVESPTTFLSMLGWRSVTLQTSSVSQTAVLDVAIVLDTSLSQADDTRKAQFKVTSGVADYPYAFDGYCGDADDNPPYALITPSTDPNNECNNSVALKNFKPFTDAAPAGLGLDPYVDFYGPLTPGSNNTLKGIRRECWYSPHGGQRNTWANYAWAGCCNDPTIQSDAPGNLRSFSATAGTGYNTDPFWYLYQNFNDANSRIMVTGTNPDGATAANLLAGGDDVPTDLALTTNDTIQAKGDGNYSDLVCQPFKQVRDAARRFLMRLDFVRGDRVVLVTFDSEAKARIPLGSAIEIINDRQTAIRTLNFQVGVEVNPGLRQIGCQSIFSANRDYENEPFNQPPMAAMYGPDVNQFNNPTYWTVSQCPATNMGGGVQIANAMLVDSRWIRREAVWVMVVLSDGFPNRTPPLPDGGGSSMVGAIQRSWLVENDFTPPANLSDYCDWPDRDIPPNALYGTKPQVCPGWGIDDKSFGFCPSWTYQAGAGANPPPAWATGAIESASPYCVDNDPDSRHFCMNAAGVINGPADTTYFCDPHYDADDYARDRVDFAALNDYTDTAAGNFIAMYSIFFANSAGGNIGTNIQGIKMLRYMADAGDDGVINNYLQRWYRDMRDASQLCPPTGLNGNSNAAAGCTQPVPTSYDPYNAFFTYTETHDPCSPLDFNSTAISDDPTSTSYNDAARTNCGQFWFASDQNAVNDAFLEIASRLFTRLSR